MFLFFGVSCVCLARLLLWVRCSLGRAPVQRCAGRSGEVGALTFDGMTYDSEFKCVYMEVPQWKSAKSKRIAILAGSDRHCDWYTAWGDLLVLQEGRQPIPREEEGNVALWLFPELSPDKTASAGTKVGSWIQALQVNGLKRYKDVWISDLPEGVSAGMVMFMIQGCVGQVASYVVRLVSVYVRS